MQSDGFGAIRVSYSILNSWTHGDIERAIAPYAGRETEPTEAMEFGKKMHAKWEHEANETKCLPKVFGGRKLISPELELATKKARKLGDWCVLTGVLDVRDGEVGIDYKTGKTPATNYLNSNQHKCYQILYPEIKRFEYYCLNQHLHKSDADHITVGIAYLNRKTLTDGIEWVMTMASELREYLINNGLGHRLDQGKGFAI